jgi:hypothetical protein
MIASWSLLLRRGATCTTSTLHRSRKTKNLRGNLNSKRGNRLYHKGYGTPKLGSINYQGTFIFDPKLEERMGMHLPDLDGFYLKPYVSLDK